MRPCGSFLGGCLPWGLGWVMGCLGSYWQVVLTVCRILHWHSASPPERCGIQARNAHFLDVWVGWGGRGGWVGVRHVPRVFKKQQNTYFRGRGAQSCNGMPTPKIGRVNAIHLSRFQLAGMTEHVLLACHTNWLVCLNFYLFVIPAAVETNSTSTKDHRYKFPCLVKTTITKFRIFCQI